MTTPIDSDSLARAEARAAKKREKLEQADREITALVQARAAITAHKAAVDALADDIVQLDAAADTAVDALYATIDTDTISDARRESLRIAIDMGADRDTLRALARAVRVARHDTIELPAGRYAGLSRGRDWRRRSDGVFADGPVGPGKWTVGSTDGFRRSSRVEWTVSHVQVGDQTWTVAS